MKILVTGCAGYIGATFTYKALLEGYDVVGVDSLICSNPREIQKIHNDFPKKFTFIKEDLAESCDLVAKALRNNSIEAVIHFAGLKAVNESEIMPLLYWSNNVGGTINLLKMMEMNGIKKIIFSSSATVYGDSNNQPVCEKTDLKPVSVYGNTKVTIENLLHDLTKQNKVKAVALRYFNPVGAHKEKKIFENPNVGSNNLMPKIVRVALNLDDSLSVYGSDYDTRDGTGERDYIHIDDLVEGHFKALDYLSYSDNFEIFNLGTGRSYSVIDIIETFKKVNQVDIKYSLSERREGDVPICYANCNKAKKVLGWKAKRNLETMCKDTWDAVKAYRNEFK